MKKVLIVASVVSFIEWFNQGNITFLNDKLGCEVHIACNMDYVEDTDAERTAVYLQRIRDEGVILHNIHFERSPFHPGNLSAFLELKRIIRSVHFDLIHCHTPTASMLTRLAALRARKKGTVVMYSCHGFHFHSTVARRNWIYYPVEKWLSRYCDYIVTVNREDFDRAKAFHCRYVRYIPSVGVDTRRFVVARIDRPGYRQGIGVPMGDIMLLSVGELIPRKNHETVIRALGTLSRRDITYVICGKGPLIGHLSNVARECGVPDKVRFLGFRNDIPELCKAADISVLPSKIEGFGMAGVEAMAAGIPLIASDIQGIRDYSADGKTGYLIAPDDVEGFAKAIDRLASDKALRESMGDECLRRVEPFEASRALRVMWDIYEEILGEQER